MRVMIVISMQACWQAQASRRNLRSPLIKAGALNDLAYLMAANITTAQTTSYSFHLDHATSSSVRVLGSAGSSAFIAVRPVPPYSALIPVSYTHLRAHETPEHLVCRLLLEKKKKIKNKSFKKYDHYSYEIINTIEDTLNTTIE
eukprot:TRINITY_DN24947_c0_g1_i1.p1 TRINITY_DN24947_c0_g1~~TRINITY_DN24947_c0_g1_i1.p1  ORF type:complete len:144 (+),score=24.46 TRINITY_DN24947_c0_g1_i1:628-1059(+)